MRNGAGETRRPRPFSRSPNRARCFSGYLSSDSLRVSTLPSALSDMK